MKEAGFTTSPIATGSGGTFFEQHVDALFLALMLIRGIPPVLIDCQVEEVHLQTGHLGWNTDDILIVSTRGAGRRRQLVAQVKLRFTISSKSEESRKVFAGFWSDFKRNDKFNPEVDRLMVVTLRGTETLLHDFNSLLDCARTSSDSVDFFYRLETRGYLSKIAQSHATAIKDIIRESEGEVPSDDEFWRFLRVLHVVSFDLNTATAQNEVWIKSLLAQTAHDSDPMAAAEATWRELLEIVGSGMPTAASYTRNDLPESLRNRHAAVAAEGSQALRTLVAHSETTLNSINTTIAHTVTIRREALAMQLLEFLDESQVVVVTGIAGSGKSALAKNLIELLHNDVFCLAFRAEEFATSHIDQTLVQAQVSVNAKRLLALLAAQGRKLILIESIERLLEANVRDAFSDLLYLARQDRSIQLVLTCRDYSADTVRTSLLDQVSLHHKVLEVPPLTDDELVQVVQAIPGLNRAVESMGLSLSKLLRSPYLLDKAARMDWAGPAAFPNDERTFRLKCWSEVVRRDAVVGAGLPARREQAFRKLALRRARALSPYVQCDDIETEAMEALRKDDLIVLSAETSALAAPAHDVLEDWAIVRWLGEQFLLHEEDARALAEDIGGYPALRRGYRKWLGEMLECEPGQTDAFVLSSFKEESLPAYFRDDTLICTLVSSSAQEFLTRQSESLLADNGRLLVRVIHLLRVACKTLPHWLPGAVSIPSQLLVPKGDAWPAVLKIVSEKLDRLLPANLGLLLGLLEDWSLSLEWGRPEPPGFHEAGKIAFALLAYLDNYSTKDLLKRTLKVITKIPRAEAIAFEDLLQRGCTLDRHDQIASEFAEILLTGLNGGFACRHFPEQIIRLSMAQFCLSDQDLRRSQDYHSSLNIEHFFGIRDHIHLDFFPASAIRGPFLPLLRSHPDIGVKFIIDFLNHACSWYGEQRWPYDRLEPARQIIMDIPREGQITQWANSRLWCLYRGLSVGPYVLQTPLMALESWLLDLCQRVDANVEALLLKLLKESNNVAVTAVVASVCNAHPAKGGHAALALLSSRELIDLDRARIVQDHGPSAVFGFLPAHDPEQKLYENERTKSGLLPHRQHHLETLAVKLQIGEQAEEVWQILDRHRDNLPTVSEQSEEHRLWRLALHRMDVRGFRPIEPETGSGDSDVTPESSSGEERHVYYGPGAIEGDIQEIVDSHVPVRARQEADLALLHWGMSVWEGNQSESIDVSLWQEKLAKAKEHDREPLESKDYCRSGPGFVAAVCVRDHWEEMNSKDRAWCVDRLIDELDRDRDTQDDMIRCARGIFRADRPAGYMLPRALSASSPVESDPRIREALAGALTHGASEVVVYTAEGIGRYLHGGWMDFTERCIGAIARQASLIEELQAAQKKIPFAEWLRGDELIRNVAPEVRACIMEGNIDVENELSRLDLEKWPGQMAARTILQILGYWTNSRLAREFYGRVAQALVESWSAKSDHRDYAYEHECSQRIARFALKLQVHEAFALCNPLLAAVASHHDEIAEFVRSLIVEEDHSEGETPFWEIWQAFAEQLCNAPWVKNLDSRYETGRKLLNIIFLGSVEWKENVRHWRRTEGQTERIDALINRLPPSAAVLQAYCRFLYKIGEHSLPNGFVIIADRLSTGSSSEMLATDNAIFHLESLLQRYVYGEPLRLKSNPRVRKAVLQILDEIIEAGSSAAFRMRDDFVTPLVN